ncbi:MAG: sialate O-acetylesterase [Clostridia bacterium]|nr:sialate O-acetylesterase [Clostridia bacterium]
MIHSFLLIGQSNMGGRGFKEEVEPISDDRISVLRNGRWRKMYNPVNPDRVTSGVNLAESFALSYANYKGVDVGLIPCADGGSSLGQWTVGGLLFDHACYMAELASRTSTIAGVLWHQGESDCDVNRYPVYKEKLTVIMNAFRKKLNLYDVPFLVGGLGDFLQDCPKGDGKFKNYVKINQALVDYSKENKMTGFVSAKGLSANADNMHFSAKALREFGLRYFEEFLKLEDKNKIFVEKDTLDNAIRNEIETL